MLNYLLADTGWLWNWQLVNFFRFWLQVFWSYLNDRTRAIGTGSCIGLAPTINCSQPNPKNDKKDPFHHDDLTALHGQAWVKIVRKGCKGSLAWVHLAFLLTQVLGTNSCPPWPRYTGCLKKASNKILLDRAGQTRATQLRRSEPSKDLASQWAPERAREREARVRQSEPEWAGKGQREQKWVRVTVTE